MTGSIPYGQKKKIAFIKILSNLFLGKQEYV